MSQIVRQIISEFSEQNHAPFALDEFGEIKEMALTPTIAGVSG